MNTSRRNFLKTGALAFIFTGAVLLKPGSGAAQETRGDEAILSDPLSSKTAEDFRRYLGAEFLFVAATGSTSAVLSEVKVAPGGSSRRRPRRRTGKGGAQNFVLSFQMPTGEFPQATYRIWHTDFGQFELFLVPGKIGENSLLHAVINRL